jgi:hypothetical protein
VHTTHGQGTAGKSTTAARHQGTSGCTFCPPDVEQQQYTEGVVGGKRGNYAERTIERDLVSP